MKKKLLIILILTITFLLLIIITLKITSLLSEKSLKKILKFSYDNSWKTTIQKKDYYELRNDNNSIIQISITNLNNENIEEDIYLNAVNLYLKNNKGYEIIRQGETKIGIDYYDAQEFNLQSETNEAFLYILEKNGYLIQINYISSNNIIDIDITNFYSVLNSIKIKDKK